MSEERHYRWENFYCLFPGEEVRHLIESKSSNLKHRLLSELDRAIAETGFDLEEYRRLTGMWRRCIDIYKPLVKKIYGDERREPTPAEERTVSKARGIENSVLKRLDDIIDPLFQRMLELGYHEDDLTC